ncbi:MAG: hypothetical protein WCJ77_05425, partial [Opitutae bacterium]
MSKILKFLGWVLLLSFGLILIILGVYLFSDPPQKIAIEQRAIDVVDKVREDQTTPDSVIRVLDQVVDKTVVVTGDVVSAPEPDAQAFAPYGEPADHLGLKHLVNKGYS